MHEKPKFHFTTDREPPRDTPELALLRQRFSDVYKEYVTIRLTLAEELQIYEQRLRIRSKLARIALTLFEISNDLKEFEERLTELLSEAAQVSLFDTTAFLNGLGIGELNRLPENEPTPIEAAWNTMENLKIANEIKTTCQDTSSGIVVSGVNAWGHFFEVRGPVPEQLFNQTIELECRENPSDIDMLITCKTVEDIKTTVNSLIDQGILSTDELDRIDFFLKAYSAEEVDIFSVRSYYKGVEQSIHFITDEVLNRISKRQCKKEGDSINFVRDFRST